MLRVGLFMPLAAGIALLLFMSMAQLAGTGRAPVPSTQAPLQLDLSRLRIDTAVHTRERARPPEPEEVVPQPALPQPQIDTQVPMPGAVPDIAMALPSIAPPVALAVAPAVPTFNVAPAFSAPSPAAVDVAPLVRIAPQYPRRALNRRVEGHVLVEFEVNAQGSITPGSFVIVESQPRGVFDRVVKRALRRWRFQPDPQGPYRTRQRLEFKLES